MITTPSSFTLEHLSSLKFKELQKLSAQYQVNKRWAKKQELIENLLALKEKNEEEHQWRDGSVVVNDLKPSDTEVNKRLTFKVEKENKYSHLTFDVPQNGENLLSEINSRETYDIPPNMSILGVEPITNPRATFDIPCKEKLFDVDPRATFDVPQTGILKDEIITDKNIKRGGKNIKLNSEIMEENPVNPTLVQGLKKLTVDISFNNGEEKNNKSKSQIKTLTIPCVRVPKRIKKDEISKNDSSPIKMSSRSINIKKSTRLPKSKNSLIRSPAVSSIKKSANKQNIKSLTVPQDINMGQSLISSRSELEPVEMVTKLVNKTKNTDDSFKENIKTILRKRHSKPENFLNVKSSLNKVNFATPPQSALKLSRVLPLKKTPLRRENKKNSAVLRSSSNVTQTPGTASNIVKKPITATKMPDFSKIHKKHFEQMDSLHDYIKKKEERIKKLFGTPQPGQQMQANNKSAPVFRFKSSENQGEIKGSEGLKNASTLSRKKENAIVQKEALKNKLPPSKLRRDVKDENRSHIQGVRTNKRFELQMKFRNM